MGKAFKSEPLKYQQVRDELAQLVKGLPPGSRLPSERDLAKTFACNVLTVRKGLAMLVAEGRIVRRPGSGTFVAGTAAPARAVRPGARVANRVGMLVYTAGDAYAQQLVGTLTTEARVSSIELRPRWIQNFGDEARHHAGALALEGCAALTLPWFPARHMGEVAAFVRQSALPVSLASLIPGLERNCFEKPEVYGVSIVRTTHALCDYFRLLGHNRIALIGPNTAQDEILQRKLGAYACYMAREKLENFCGLVGGTAGDMDALAAQWQRYRGNLAVISYDDTHAVRFMTAMHKLGLAAPADYAIVGFNNVEAGRFFDPPLSSVDHDFRYLAKWLLRSALALGRGDEERSSSIAPHHLVLRASCGGAENVNSRLVRTLQKSGLEITVEGRKPVPMATTATA